MVGDQLKFSDNTNIMWMTSDPMGLCIQTPLRFRFNENTVIKCGQYVSSCGSQDIHSNKNNVMSSKITSNTIGFYALEDSTNPNIVIFLLKSTKRFH